MVARALRLVGYTSSPGGELVVGLAESSWFRALRKEPSSGWRATQLSVGRDSANDLCLRDRAVSRRHFTISKTDAAFQLIDLESHNGTFVNGIPVRRKLLAHGDTIRVGRCELVFLITEDEELVSQMVQFSEQQEPVDLLTTTKLQAYPALGSSGTDVGRMARDLNALFKIANTINSIRDLEPLQQSSAAIDRRSHPGRLRRHRDSAPRRGRAQIQLRLAPATGRHRSQLRIRRELVQRALWERSPILSRPTPESGESESVLCVPLVGGGKNHRSALPDWPTGSRTKLRR